MTKAQYNKYIQHTDIYFKANFDGNKVPFNPTKEYKLFAAQCTALINDKHCPISFNDYTTKGDAYKAFNAIMPSYTELSTVPEPENIWANV